jgi:hypothetical protein
MGLPGEMFCFVCEEGSFSVCFGVGELCVVGGVWSFVIFRS